MITAKEKVAIYIKAQTAEEAEISQEKLIKYCLESNYEVTKRYIDIGGDYTGFCKMRNARRLTRIVVLSLSQLRIETRSINDTLCQFNHCFHKDIEVVNCGEIFSRSYKKGGNKKCEE